MLTLARSQVEQIFTHARSTVPNECCGLIGGTGPIARTIYPLRNIALNSAVAYEAAPEELFNAQRQMRERGEQLLAIYHSHPRSDAPEPSETDVRLAYYPAAIYLIVGLAGEQPALRAYRITERELRWEPVEYAISDE